MPRRSTLIAYALPLVLSATTPATLATAATGVCGSPISGGSLPNQADALAALLTASGGDACQPCECDIDSDGVISASDALSILQKAIGFPISLTCPSCGGASGTPPIPTLPVVEVTDLDGDGNYDQDDIDIAMDDCSPGCNLRLLPVIYRNFHLVIDGSVSQGFAMYGAGSDRTTLQVRLTPPGGYYNDAISVDTSAPDGIVLQDFTLDGMKFQQPLPTQTADPSPANSDRSTGIVISNFRTSDIHTDGVIRRLQIKDFFHAGIVLMHAARWRIEGNQITNIGCHTIDTPCGSGWRTMPDIDGQPNRKTNGFGIILGRNNTEAIIADNTVSGATKMAIEIFGGGGQPCESPSTPRNIIIENNTVTRAGSGIGVNGGCNYIIRDNVVEGSIATGSENYRVGQGFFCAAGGKNGVWLRNRASNNQLNGFDLDCTEENIDVVQNISSNNCLTTTWSTADISVATWTKETGRSGGEILDNTVSSNNCFAGMRIAGRTDVRVSGGSIEGGGVYGIWLFSVANISISNLRLNARPSLQTPGTYDSDVGILLNTGIGSVEQISIDPVSVLIRNFRRAVASY